MTQKNFNTIAGYVFILVALVHVWRAISGTDVWFGQTEIPVWISWIAALVTLVLGTYGLKHGKKR